MLNDRAHEILGFIRRFAREHGFPPTIREIGVEFGISSTNGVRFYLKMLEKAGYLKRCGKISRGLVPVTPGGAVSSAPSFGYPLLGTVAAGQPILAEESFDGSLDPRDVFGDPRGMFALRVRGDSMIEAGIFEGDYVVVRQQEAASAGEIIVALVEDDATVKYFHPRRGSIELVAANPKYQPIVVSSGMNFRILGVVRGVMRTVGR
ncbi:MAG: transcriptional repressor LexA [Candidatus Eisenbacteria bacterium]|nr:transcriptional repressor LexA [Candidatus Eisenbacteria bacterium]